MPTESLRIEEVTDLEIVPQLARLCDIALKPDGLHTFLEKYGTTTVYNYAVEHLTTAIEDPSSHVFKAMLTTTDADGTVRDQLVGVTQWYHGYLIVPKVDPFAPKGTSGMRQDAHTISEVAIADEAGSATVLPQSKPETASNTLDPAAELTRKLGNSHVNAIRGKRHIYLRRMMVHPDYQRKGIAQKMLQWGTDLADQEKIVSWLFARPAGSRLYEKNGWRAVSSTEVDVPDVKVAPVVSMLRLPRPSVT